MNLVWAPQPGPQASLVSCPAEEIFFGGARGGGKCIPLDEPVLTPFGFREMREIEPGSQVCNPNGTVSRVIACYRPGEADVWRVRFNDGTHALCDDGHIWTGHFVGHRVKRGGLKLWTFAQIRAKYERDKNPSFLLPLPSPVRFTRPHTTKHGNSLQLEPYALGVLLGDGNLTADSIRYATVDDEIDAHMSMFGTVRVDDGPNRRLIDAPAMLAGLRALGLWGKYAYEKRVPEAYRWASESTRRACLQGLMDTDGTADERGQCYFTSTSEGLVDDVVWLARTLGYKASTWTKGTTHRDAYNAYIQGPDRGSLFRLDRKRERADVESQAGTHAKSIVEITQAGRAEVGCFQVDDPNGLFMLRDCTVTHNTDGVLGKWGVKAMRYGNRFNAAMFRRTLTSADDAIERSRQIYEPLGGKFRQDTSRWSMPGGGRIAFRYLDSIADAEHQQGKNLTDAWIEEAGQYADPAPIDRLFGALRSPTGVPIQLILTANPGGAGQTWLRDRYQLSPLPTRPCVMERELDDGTKRKFAVIPSRITDNAILLKSDPGYVDRLKLVGNAQLVKAWLDGDWSAIEGAFFSDWGLHLVVCPFAIPENWIRFRAFDWGSARPFSVGWWAYATERDMGIPQGALVRYREWYGASKPNVGLKLTTEEVRDGILEREDVGERIDYSVADPAIFAEDGGPSIAERMLPIAWQPADNKRVGTLGHVGGWDQTRGRMRDSMLFVFDTCTDFLRTIPLQQHDIKRPEDLDSDGEDHVADEARYACMSRIYRRHERPDAAPKQSPHALPPRARLTSKSRRTQSLRRS